MKNNKIIFSNLRNIALIGTFFFLWLAIFSEEYIENIFAYLLILSFGIIHGANDIKLIEKVGGFKAADFLKLTVYYSVFILFNFMLFYFVPSLALLLFVLFSGYHFGEQHWISKITGSLALRSVFFLSYGLCILFLLFNAHHTLVDEVIYNITSIAMPDKLYLIAFVLNGVLALVLYIILNFRSLIISDYVIELFLILVFFIVFNTASLLWSFTIYFILWHSIPSLVDQIIFLYGSCTKKNILKYVKSSFFYWIFAVISLGVALFFLKDTFEQSLALFFSFLAAITFPHVIVIKKLNNS